MQIAIIGLGLIGGSLAKALKENTEHTVIGFDRDENTLLDALSLGAIDSVGSTSLLENADVVYVCLYPADVRHQKSGLRQINGDRQKLPVRLRRRPPHGGQGAQRVRRQ